MKKKLVIKFWKAEKALAMQILEQEGLSERKGRGFVSIVSVPYLAINTISLRGNSTTDDFNINSQIFSCNEERDEYLNKAVNAITDELFTSNGELNVGELCEFSNDNETWEVHPLITILREGLLRRYLANVGYNIKAWDCFEHARPICKRIEPKIEVNGEIITYTWKEE